MKSVLRAERFRVWLWVLAGALATALPAGSFATEAPAQPTDAAQWKLQRKKAAHRPRRIIFNNDGDDVVYECKNATPEALLQCRTTALLGSQVDSIFYCTWSSGLGVFTHNTKLGEVFTCTEKGFSNNKTAEFLKQGTDPLRIMIDFCRKHQIEVFWSLRTNDTHDAWNDWYSPYLFPRVKREHPEFMVASGPGRSKHGGWTALDYGRPEVRELAFRYVEEVCQNYDVDGVELDFCRHLVHFKRHAMGQDAGDEERAMMTDLLRRIRAMTESTGRRRGRPILVAVRVPDSVGYCAAVGLDIVRWMEEDLIDLMAVSDYFRLNPWETSIQLGRRYGVPVYPCLSESRIADREAAQVRNSLECYRARAMEAYDAGACGVYMFNFFNPHSPLWRELGDAKHLATLERVYCAGVRGVGPINQWLANGERFLTRQILSPERPRKLRPGEAASLELRLGGEAERIASHNLAARVQLRLRVPELAHPDDLTIRFNDRTIPGATKSGQWVEARVASEAIRRGVNRLEFSVKPGAAGCTVQDVLLWIRPASAPSKAQKPPS